MTITVSGNQPRDIKVPFMQKMADTYLDELKTKFGSDLMKMYMLACTVNMFLHGNQYKSEREYIFNCSWPEMLDTAKKTKGTYNSWTASSCQILGHAATLGAAVGGVMGRLGQSGVAAGSAFGQFVNVGGAYGQNASEADRSILSNRMTELSKKGDLASQAASTSLNHQNEWLREIQRTISQFHTTAMQILGATGG
jgi:hypothetical protein